jgi:hypothetical protein
LYALNMRALGMGRSLGSDPSWIDTNRPEAERIGQAALARAAAAGCSATLRIIDGLAEDVVLKLAPSLDLLVIGTRGFSGFAHLLDHSVIEAVVFARRPYSSCERDNRYRRVRGRTIVMDRLIVPIDASSVRSERARDLDRAFDLNRT